MKKILVALSFISALLTASLAFADTTLNSPEQKFSIDSIPLEPGVNLTLKGVVLHPGSIINGGFKPADFKVTTTDYSKLEKIANPQTTTVIKILATNLSAHQHVMIQVTLPKLPDNKEQALLRAT